MLKAPLCKGGLSAKQADWGIVSIERTTPPSKIKIFDTSPYTGEALIGLCLI